MQTEVLNITLNADDIEILKSLRKEAEGFTSNAFVTNDDVISGLLNFYKNAILIDYQKQFQHDMPIYIGGRVMAKK